MQLRKLQSAVTKQWRLAICQEISLLERCLSPKCEFPFTYLSAQRWSLLSHVIKWLRCITLTKKELWLFSSIPSLHSFKLALPTNDILCNIWKAEVKYSLFFFYALKFGACGWVQAQWQLIYTIRDPLAHPGDVQQHLEPQFLQLLLDLLLQLFSLWAGTCMVPWWKAPSSLSSHPVSLRLEMESLYTSDQFLLMYSAILMSFWFILSRLFQAFFPNRWSDWQLQFQYWMLR